MAEGLLSDVFFDRAVARWSEALRARESDRAGAAAESLAVSMAAFGVTADALPALALSSLVEVAWSDGDLDVPERTAVLAGVEAAGLVAGSAGHGLVQTWLEACPPPELFALGREYRRQLSADLSVETRFRVREHLVDAARSVAEASGGFLGMRAVSSEEEAVLEQLDEDFGL
ncbi:MAG: hypothetical protein OEP95_13435 [Myxococcales bacterium]|nr:hypothetical protein [Myxococcales bacterium]